jgi:hypothetical protein
MKVGRPKVLPRSLPPRGLSREEAAEWWGISPTLFDRGVADGLIPQGVRFYGRRLWDLRKLEVAFAALDFDDAAEDPARRLAL